jgi:hypothetical protein
MSRPATHRPIPQIRLCLPSAVTSRFDPVDVLQQTISEHLRRGSVPGRFFDAIGPLECLFDLRESGYGYMKWVPPLTAINNESRPTP